MKTLTYLFIIGILSNTFAFKINVEVYNDSDFPVTVCLPGTATKLTVKKHTFGESGFYDATRHKGLKHNISDLTAFFEIAENNNVFSKFGPIVSKEFWNKNEEMTLHLFIENNETANDDIKVKCALLNEETQDKIESFHFGTGELELSL